MNQNRTHHADALLDLYNDLAKRYPDFHTRSERWDRTALRSAALAAALWKLTLLALESEPPGPRSDALSRKLFDDEQYFAERAALLDERLEMMRPPSADHAAIEREILGAFSNEADA